jgi:aminopeptidase N
MDHAESAPVIRLADYRPPAWRVSEVELLFELDAAATEVEATLQLQRDPDQPPAPLRLHGEELELLWLELDGVALDAAGYRIDAQGLTIDAVPGARCTLRSRVRIHPERNTRLEGLYASQGALFTQCEAEGFRRITWFVDQPDVSARYAVTLRADAASYPVLLSNGNPAGAGALPDGRHWARWVDPFPKPSYLFALVAGQLDCLRETFRCADGREVAVQVWADPADVGRCRHALESTLRAMAWDERRFGRIYDLDVFNIVAAQDFTMGAMENKGLNIFNARYILADPDTATDADYEGVESVIGHEYFHNWSGNRVTLRDWFQLSLKEGLTVFRDQEFSADLQSRALKRIEDVRLLKSRQFVEDAGSLAHPVRPHSYTEINNFYTATVYEKGAEVVRMLHTLLGEAAFRRGLDAYFARHDGGAATIEDFLGAMAEASGRDLRQFARWYDQAGTPELTITQAFDAARGEYTLTIEQRTPPTPDGEAKRPLHIPLAYALYGADGRRLDALPQGDAQVRPGLIELTAARHTLQLLGLAAAPLPAFLQGLSAPVRLQLEYSAQHLARLVAFEPDPLTRWEATQRLATEAILRRDGNAGAAREALVDALGGLLDDAGADPGFVAECHQLPDIWTLCDQCPQVDIDSLWREREDLLDLLAETHAERYERGYRDAAARAGDGHDAATIALRRLKNLCLTRLTRLDPTGALAGAQFSAATRLTDRLAALAALLHHEVPSAGAALAAFRGRYAQDPLVTDKWLALVASRPQPDAVEQVQALLHDPLWTPRNPNRVRALLGSFARNNPVGFHRRDGAGYALLFAQVPVLDALNPQVAARQLTVLENWRRLDPARQALIGGQLEALAARVSLSRDSSDVVARLRA